MEQRKNVAILPIQMFDPFIDLHMILIIIGPCGNCHCSLFTRLYVKETKWKCYRRGGNSFVHWKIEVSSILLVKSCRMLTYKSFSLRSNITAPVACYSKQFD
ncbi:uncharacterized protein LOC111796447 isoform X1 [Cucurbita pepo subsp. pepo]|uniref:uncharacterized protein LOC111796447 isoform X1 n=1 Tax=Cucurbita pepo subsp. pepo TaxID=3664 RepID=UPI000C9D61C8|nr:uncharacterized protein LOC111796447 isoform X1 [Cucurbita pepo subsp. pepo]